MAVQVKEEKPKELTIEKLIKRDIAALERKIADLNYLLDGLWYSKYLQLQNEIIRKAQTLRGAEALAYMDSMEPEKAKLKKLADKSRNSGKLFDKLLKLEDEKHDLERELESIQTRKFLRGY